MKSVIINFKFWIPGLMICLRQIACLLRTLTCSQKKQTWDQTILHTRADGMIYHSLLW